ncbi:hypothetical protein T08_7832 [Trichinella sp. T8]|nr:hypothetical protein T08_7680 [Trichinella sp. T8]KRZ90900.1 hypothetical protein T08_7832 [Trichinella sp. T8]
MSPFVKHYDEHYDDLEPILFLFGDSETLRKIIAYCEYDKNDAYPNFQTKCSISDWDIEFLATPGQTTEKNSIVHVVMFKDCGNDEKNRELDIENYSPSEWLFFLLDKISISGILCKLVGVANASDAYRCLGCQFVHRCVVVNHVPVQALGRQPATTKFP